MIAINFSDVINVFYDKKHPDRCNNTIGPCDFYNCLTNKCLLFRKPLKRKLMWPCPIISKVYRCDECQQKVDEVINAKSKDCEKS